MATAMSAHNQNASATAGARGASNRCVASYTSQPPPTDPMAIASSVRGVSDATDGSPRSARPPAQYTMSSSANPLNHVVYACHLNQCTVRGSVPSPPANSVFST